ITVAAHIAVMAPGTNIGAAHPVALGIGGGMDKTMSKKVENDAVAYVRGIANKRARNEEWVEKAVRKSESITAEEALRLKVIDFVATDLNRLLEQADGREVSLAVGKKVLKTKGAILNEKIMGTRQKVLSALSDPNIAYILLLIGLAGIYFEFSTPGVILPGVIGGISLIMAFFAMQTLPVNYAGVALILFSIILFIAEIKVISHGILTIGGIVSLTIGSLMLFQAPDPSLRVSWGVLIPAVSIASLFFIAVIAIAVKAQLRPRQGGQEGMRGEEGLAITDIREEGKVLEREIQSPGCETPADFHQARLGPRRVGADDFLAALFGPYYGRGMRGFIEIRVIGEKGAKSYFFRGLRPFEKKRFESRTRHTFYGLLPREKREGRKEAVKWISK
ncbi:MAG: hypothetical protein AAB299_09075, partial [Thermodesulfobacteriota bacterium]